MYTNVHTCIHTYTYIFTKNISNDFVNIYLVLIFCFQIINYLQKLFIILNKVHVLINRNTITN